MNSRMRRKAEAERHNNRRILLSELTHIQSEIYRKHRVYVRASYDDTNQSVSDEIERLKLMFECDAPPPKKVSILGGGSIARMQLAAIARMQLAAIAEMAGIGHIK